MNLSNSYYLTSILQDCLLFQLHLVFSLLNSAITIQHKQYKNWIPMKEFDDSWSSVNLDIEPMVVGIVPIKT